MKTNLPKALLTAPLDIVAAVVAAYLLLRVLPTRNLWLMDAISVFSFWILIISVPLTVLAIRIKRWPTAALLATGTAAFILLFGQLFLPSLRGASGSSQAYPCNLRVMTFNLSNGVADPRSSIKSIENSSPDILGVEEFAEPQIAAVREGLHEQYPYQVVEASGMDGIALLSKFPITQYASDPLGGTRPYVFATIEAGSCKIRAIVAHPPVIFGPGAPQSRERLSISAVAGAISPETNTILIGDFNLTDQNRGYQTIREAGWIDAFRVAGFGPGFTYPRRSWSGGNLVPLLRIDFIFLSPGVYTSKSWVGADGGSDHLPVLAEISWDPTGPQ